MTQTPKPYGCHNRAPIVTVCKQSQRRPQMSMHKIPLTEVERNGLQNHGLAVWYLPSA